MYHINDTVQTPSGLGLVQGRAEIAGKPTQIIVAHTPKVSGDWVRQQADYQGFWVIRMYPVEKVSKVMPTSAMHILEMRAR